MKAGTTHPSKPIQVSTIHKQNIVLHGFTQMSALLLVIGMQANGEIETPPGFEKRFEKRKVLENISFLPSFVFVHSIDNLFVFVYNFCLKDLLLFSQRVVHLIITTKAINHKRPTKRLPGCSRPQRTTTTTKTEPVQSIEQRRETLLRNNAIRATMNTKTLVAQ